MFDEYAQKLIAKHRLAGILIDANLLLLLVVGSYRPARIATFKRTSTYSRHDLGLLREFAGRFAKRWTTPNILTEVDNLGRQLSSSEHPEFSSSLRRFVDDALEIYHPFRNAAALSEFRRLGLSDAVSLLQNRDCLLLSDDLSLCICASRLGYDAINFNHIRLSAS